MKNKRAMLLILLLLSASILVVSCNSESKKLGSKTPEPDNSQTEPIIFQIDAEDISSVSIFRDDQDKGSGEIQKKEDIKELTRILNGSSTGTGAVTGDLYRELIIHKKNKETLRLIFGAGGTYFINEADQFGYRLKSHTKTSALNELVDRIETKENSKPTFKINSEDVAGITAFQKKTTEINKKEDIETIVKILNSNKSDEGKMHNSILTLELKVHMNDGSEIIVRFGSGTNMSVEDVGGFSLSTQDHSQLVEIIERLEQDK